MRSARWLLMVGALSVACSSQGGVGSKEVGEGSEDVGMAGLDYGPSEAGAGEEALVGLETGVETGQFEDAHGDSWPQGISQECRQCLESHCSDEVGACSANGDCLAIIFCLDEKCEEDSTFDECLQLCISAHPNGKDVVEALLACTALKCQMACLAEPEEEDKGGADIEVSQVETDAVDATHQELWSDLVGEIGGDVGGEEPQGEDKCIPCLQEKCPNEYNACAKDPECVAIKECFDEVCSNDEQPKDKCYQDCIAAHPEGEPEMIAVIQCLIQHCKPECS